MPVAAQTTVARSDRPSYRMPTIPIHRTPRKLHQGHFAFMRALVQGLDERAAWNRYLAQEGDATDLRLVNSQLHVRDPAHTHLAIVSIEDWSERLRLVLDGVDADVRVQHELAHHSPSRICSAGCSRATMKSSLAVGPANQASQDSPTGEITRERPHASTLTSLTPGAKATALGKRTAWVLLLKKTVVFQASEKRP